MHADALQVLNTTQTLQLTSLLAILIQSVQTPLQDVNGVVNPVFQGLREQVLYIDGSQQTNINQMTFLIGLVRVVGVETTAA